MSNEHTPGKLTVTAQTLFSATSHTVARTAPSGPTSDRGSISAAEADRNAERLAACWNACDGINPAAVADLLTLAHAVVSFGHTTSTTYKLATDALAKAGQA